MTGFDETVPPDDDPARDENAATENGDLGEDRTAPGLTDPEPEAETHDEARSPDPDGDKLNVAPPEEIGVGEDAGAVPDRTRPERPTRTS